MGSARTLLYRRTTIMRLLPLFCVFFGLLLRAQANASVSNQTLPKYEQYHPLTLSFTGPHLDELKGDNPFLDHGLNVWFQHACTRRLYLVPGYFAADGNAAESGATSGSVWRVHFTPELEGEWRYFISFRSGPGAALGLPGAWTAPPNSVLHGHRGAFLVVKSSVSPDAADFRGKGKLRYVGKRYLRFDNGQYFLKFGINSPENLLGYADFDNTPKARHRYAQHVKDWRSGDPSWRGGRGKGLVGMLNYLAQRGINGIYLMPTTVRGDAKDTYPWVSERDFLHFDVSKLAQWEKVFGHCDKLGIHIHIVLSETENEEIFEEFEKARDGHRPFFAKSRKLYYREMIARFGHHNAITWNMGEETGWRDPPTRTSVSTQLREAIFKYLRIVEPYRHLLAAHTFPAEKSRVYGPLLRDRAPISGASLQIAKWSNTFREVREWVTRSRNGLHPWVVTVDEIGGSGVRPDRENGRHDSARKDVLYPTLMAGGAGIEWYNSRGDQSLETWKPFDKLLRQTKIARDFFSRIRLEGMESRGDVISRPNSALVGKDQSLFIIYAPRGVGAGPLRVQLASGTYSVRWYDTRNGEFRPGSIRRLTGNGRKDVGSPPYARRDDWICVLTHER